MRVTSINSLVVPLSLFIWVETGLYSSLFRRFLSQRYREYLCRRFLVNPLSNLKSEKER